MVKRLAWQLVLSLVLGLNYAASVSAEVVASVAVQSSTALVSEEVVVSQAAAATESAVVSASASSKTLDSKKQGYNLSSPSSTFKPTSANRDANPVGSGRVIATSPSPISPSSVTQLVLGLGLVIALILALAWAAKRMGTAAGITHSGLRVVAALPLSTRERLVLIQAGEQQLLVGVAPGQVNLLKSFDDPIVDPSNAGNSFAERLKEAMSKGRGN